MERISALIEKLRDQFAAGADIDQLLLSTQLLEGELRYHLQKGTVPASAHVAVVMPGNHRPLPSKIPNPGHDTYLPQENVESPQEATPRTEPFRRMTEPVATAQANAQHAVQTSLSANPAPAPQPQPQYQPAARAQPAPPPQYQPAAQAHPAPQPQYQPAPAPQPTPPSHAAYQPPAQAAAPAPLRQAAAAPREADPPKYNPIREVPTLTHQIPQEARGKELNEVIAVEAPRSLNDTWKEQQPEKKEVSAKLTDTPVKDLRKAVGINDRYLFISELFRGDETMYERSIKTINNFSIFQEAYYWMERELKLKLAWDQEKHSTQLFYQLVRRRFAT
jgi:hypothetical protein